MPSLLLLTRCAFIGWVLLAVVNPAVGAQPSEVLLPDTTTGYVSVANVTKLRESWRQTQFGQLMSDPVMEDFVADLLVQLRDRFSGLHDKLGIELEDLEDVLGGEVSLALVQATVDTTAIVLLADVADHSDRARQLLAKISDRLIERGATKREVEAHGATVTVFTLPDGEGEGGSRTAVSFLHEDILCVSDHEEVVTSILGRSSGEAKDSLRDQRAFRAVMKRCQDDAGSLMPELRWFIDPFGFVDAVRSHNLVQRKRGKDMIKVLERQGFSAILGVGGHLNFYVEDQYEMIHRTSIFAPPVEGRADKSEKYEWAARMLNFPNAGRIDPQPWIPREIATYTSFNWEIGKAFNYLGSLVDEIILGRNDKGELETGAFQDIIDDIKNQEFGPKTDIRADLVAHLGTRTTVITDYQIPITPKSERMLVAIEATNSEKLAATIEKNMESDTAAKRREYNGHVIWEIVEEGDELPELEIETIGIGPPLGFGGFEEEEEEEEEMGAPSNRSVCVALGQLMIASHIDLLKKVLSDPEARSLLKNTEDYKQIDAAMARLSPGELSLRAFSRTDDEYRPTYELIRAGRMPEAETTLGNILNELLGEDKEGVLRTQKIDGSKLPEFDVVRRYLGAAGLASRGDENGWFLIGFTLNKEAP